ncbi:hypothetical protein [Phocaeicola vulgatus]|nr:hypothetical protein [Phocaeicola vulgatus]UVO93753.1 hypothetical protein NXU81_18670 [Phocaeicola vulgatus]
MMYKYSMDSIERGVCASISMENLMRLVIGTNDLGMFLLME